MTVMETNGVGGRRSGTAGCACGAQWGGSRTCHCSSCHLTFTSLSGFDQHRPGACLPPEQVGLVVLRTSGNQDLWGIPDTSGRWGGSPAPDRPEPVERELGTGVSALLAELNRMQGGADGRG